MELKFLKKQTRAHKYRVQLSTKEIDSVLMRYVPRLRSIQILNITDKRFPEVQDERDEKTDALVAEARHDLQIEFRRKIKLPGPELAPMVHMALEAYLRRI